MKFFTKLTINIIITYIAISSVLTLGKRRSNFNRLDMIRAEDNIQSQYSFKETNEYSFLRPLKNIYNKARSVLGGMVKKITDDQIRPRTDMEQLRYEYATGLHIQKREEEERKRKAAKEKEAKNKIQKLKDLGNYGPLQHISRFGIIYDDPRYSNVAWEGNWVDRSDGLSGTNTHEAGWFDGKDINTLDGNGKNKNKTNTDSGDSPKGDSGATGDNGDRNNGGDKIPSGQSGNNQPNNQGGSGQDGQCQGNNQKKPEENFKPLPPPVELPSAPLPVSGDDQAGNECNKPITNPEAAYVGSWSEKDKECGATGTQGSIYMNKLKISGDKAVNEGLLGFTATTGAYSKYFECSRQEVAKKMNPRYVLTGQETKLVQPDISARFLAEDTLKGNTVILKLFFKGPPTNCEFYNHHIDKVFDKPRLECLNHKTITNRLYNKPASYEGAITINDEKVYKDVALPDCLTMPSKTEESYYHYFTTYKLPEGENLEDKCLVKSEISNTNSCMFFLKDIALGALHALDLFNRGSRFFAHGNINPRNILLKVAKEGNVVLLDNMKYDGNNYNNIKDKPFKDDMNDLGDTLLTLLLGTDEKVIDLPIKGAFDLYVKAFKYIDKKGYFYNLKTSALNVPNDISSISSKVVTVAEYEHKLRGSIFNLIYRLKNQGVEPENQFTDIAQAVNHEFSQSNQLPPSMDKSGEQIDSKPSDCA